MSYQEKRVALVEAGCVWETRRDDGETKTGWWQDDVYLSDHDGWAYEALFA